MRKVKIILISIVFIIWCVILFFGAASIQRADNVLANTQDIETSINAEEKPHICPPPEIIEIEKEIIKEVITEYYIYIEVEKEIEPIFKVTPEERELLAELVYYEARGEKFPGQCAVVSVVFNRMKYNGNKNVKEVIKASGAFSPWGNGSMNGKTEEIENSNGYYDSIYEAVDFVIKYGVTIDEYVTYFRTNNYHDWGTKYKNYCQIGSHYFSYKVENYNKWLENQNRK